MFRDVKITLEEEAPKNWQFKIRCVPPQITKIRTLTFLNQCQIPNQFFYPKTIPREHSYRIQRWTFLEDAANAAADELKKSAFLIGSQFNWNVKLAEAQIASFTWRHAIPLPLHVLMPVLTLHAQSLVHLEVSMIQPPSHSDVQMLESALSASHPLSKLRSLVYRGLSHTEPLQVNNPVQGGRFRMLRPIFRNAHSQIQDLVLSQDHCVSQIGRTPLINGRVHRDTLCTLDELYFNPADPAFGSLLQTIDLNLTKLELGGFYVSLLADPSARMRLNLSQLRALTLTDCDGLDNLFTSLTSRSDELCLTSFALRYNENNAADDDAETVATRLDNFLMSFKGLELLSILWSGSHTPAALGQRVLTQHSEHLEVYNIDLRDPQDPDLDSPSLRFLAIPQMNTSSWSPSSTSSGTQTVSPCLREIAFNLTMTEEQFTEYTCLRLLSRYQGLRTVHIRNFPPIRTAQSPSNKLFWRINNSVVTPTIVEAVNKFAEKIALPFHGVLHQWEQECSLFPNLLDDLRALAVLHTATRDKQLLGDRFAFKWQHSSSTPIKDLTARVLKQRAEVDAGFATLKTKVDLKVATDEEETRYHEIVHDIRVVLGHEKPTLTEKPKLRLLIIGDWRYRDQMNITGPRTWDPNAWCTSKKDEDLDDIDMDPIETDSEADYHRNQRFNFTYSFKKEWDINLRPLFFEIDWKVRKTEDGRYRWKADAKVLPQVTLEGERTLSDVRSLEHAWGN